MKYTGPKVKLSRRLKLALTPKAVRVMENKFYSPGEHGESRRRPGKMSDYKRQLVEKQRLRSQYNVHERQMRNYARKATRMSGNPGDNLVQLLELRLDAVVFRSGLARTIYSARQYVSHRHILVNGRWVNIPSQQLKGNDVISVREESRDLPCFREVKEEMINAPPAYLERSAQNMTVKLVHLPEKEEIPVSCEVPLVIEYYSKQL